MKTARQMAETLGVPLAYLHCEDDQVAHLLLALRTLKPLVRRGIVSSLLDQMVERSPSRL